MTYDKEKRRHTYYCVDYLAELRRCNSKIALIKSSGRGGHPGTSISTGIIFEMPFSTDGLSAYKPPEIAQLPIAITNLGLSI